jgi:hypothetical protein
MLRYISSILSFIRAFVMNGCWILSMAFFCIYWNDHVFFSLLLSIYYIIYNDLSVLNHPFIPGMKPTSS